MKVLMTEEVDDYLTELVQVLYDESYFGFEDAAIEYIFDLYDDIKTSLP
ncbi:hypothetical protein [Dysgonomonas termitidis]|uniref:Uncharacterized protein n=1 Tax=Dysgonomonas termitidis TaxID=1516126 RepID=A0ABV9KV24_9BACT